MIKIVLTFKENDFSRFFHIVEGQSLFWSWFWSSGSRYSLSCVPERLTARHGFFSEGTI